MAKMLRDEVQLLKGFLMEVDDDTVALVTEQYHTESNPSTGKVDRSKSFYHWVARSWKKADYDKLINWYMDDARRLQRGHWPDDKRSFYLAIGNGSENWRIGDFLRTKLKKVLSWENGQKIMNGWKSKTAKRDEGYYPTAKYVVDGYDNGTGTALSLADKETFLKNIGCNLIAKPTMKSHLPPSQKAIA